MQDGIRGGGAAVAAVAVAVCKHLGLAEAQGSQARLGGRLQGAAGRPLGPSGVFLTDFLQSLCN